jgi:hypothetical protein
LIEYAQLSVTSTAHMDLYLLDGDLFIYLLLLLLSRPP